METCSVRTTRQIFVILALLNGHLATAREIVVRPIESDQVLVNPGIGFMTFQRFNGDRLNPHKKLGQGFPIRYQPDEPQWTEGLPIDYQSFEGQPFDANHTNPNFPQTSLAYFRVYWKFVEPEQGQYNWPMIDKALETATARGQTLLLRIAPYGKDIREDVPSWYRAMVGPEKSLPPKWQTDPEDPRYAKHFGGFIRAFGARYDGDPRLESVDLAIVGSWGEGYGSDRLTDKSRKALLDAYLDSFEETPLLMLLTDKKTNGYGLSKQNVGWRVDCLGDLGGSSRKWCHMYDYYPQIIVQTGMKDAWKKGPISFEVCWIMQHWKDMGWDIDYIIDQSLKWHISSFNAKSSAVPSEWKPQVDRWLKRMGYRFVLRKFTYPATIKPGGELALTSWWENKGVAPCYHPFRLALRLLNEKNEVVLPVPTDLCQWLPGDIVLDEVLSIPAEVPSGEYHLDIGILDTESDQPKIKLAIEGRLADGWYRLGSVQVQ